MKCKITLFRSAVCFHVLVQGGSMNERFLALGALELFHSSMSWDMGSQVRMH